MSTPPVTDWERLQKLLPPILELPTGERQASLEQAAAGDPVLQAELESFLIAHDRSSLLDRPPPALCGLAAHGRDEAAPSLRRTANHYDLLERVARGGMGVVYRARDRRLERTVALKFLPPHVNASPAAKQRFLLEARAAARLDHPNICTIYETGESDDGRLFIAMPYYEGDTVRGRLEHGPLPIAEAIDIAVQVASGLAKAHAHGIVHRDIKPANLMITADGITKIVDFGVAALSGIPASRPELAIGTLAYMSPEQTRGGDIDGRTDIWSLGIVLYEMLTGVRPFRAGSDGELLDAIRIREPDRMGRYRLELSGEVEAIVLACLAKRRDDRFSTALAMAEALAALRDRGGTGIAVATARVSTPQPGAAPAVAAAPGGRLVVAGHAASEVERRQVTVVAFGLSGYDTLVDEIGPEELERVASHLRSLAAEIAGRHGGVLDQFTGDQLLLLFGLPVALEDDAVRAARAAAELHASVTDLFGTQLRLRADVLPTPHTGIHTGRVVAQPSSDAHAPHRLTGSAPAVAHRLRDHAGAGEIWVSAESRRLIAPYFELEPRQALPGLGRAQPLAAFRLIHDTGLRTRLEASIRTGLTAFTGRDAELASLQTALKMMRQSGEGRLVRITGEAGMGKSRLLHELRGSATSLGATVLTGRCPPHSGGLPYLPFVEILREGLGIPSSDAERAVARIRAIGDCLEEFLPLYLHLLSIASTAFPIPMHLRRDSLRRAMPEAVSAILGCAARNAPVVVMLEDWHWADVASQAVLRHLTQELRDRPLLVLVTERPGYAEEGEAPGPQSEICLQPLEPTSTGTVLQAVLGLPDLPTELVPVIQERTGGNPFFIEEMGRALVEEGSLTIRGGALSLEPSATLHQLPDSIEGVIRARLDRLPPTARYLLRLCAVAGTEFPRSLLEPLFTPSSQLSPALKALEAAGLIQRTAGDGEAGYRFKHVLTQEVAYASILEHQRREMHGRVGMALERLHDAAGDAHLDRLAHHFSHSEAWSKAARYGLLAADRAGRLAQYPEALHILARTLRAVERHAPAPERESTTIDILLRQERLCETLGRRTLQQTLIDRLIDLLSESEDGARLAEVFLRQGDLLTLRRNYDAAEASLLRSLHLRRAAGDRMGERNTLRSLGLLRWHQGRNREALDLAEETLRIDRERGESPAVVGDLTNCGAILRAMGEHARACAVLEEAVAMADSTPPGVTDSERDELTVQQVYALQNLSGCYREGGDREKALECLHRAGALAEQRRLPIALGYHQTSLAHLHLQGGRIEESLRHYRRAVDVARQAHFSVGLAQSLRIYGEVLAGLGRHDEALPYLREAAVTFAELWDAHGESSAWSAVAAAEEARRNDSAAVEAWEKASRLAEEIDEPAAALVAIEGLARTTRLHDSDPAAALTLYHRGAALAETIGDTITEGRIRNIIGILEWSRGSYAGALAQYQRALTLFEESGDEAGAGLMLNSIGATLKALGRSTEAEQRLEEALARHRQACNPQLRAHALALLGDLRADRGEDERATELYVNSLELRRVIGDRRGEGWMLHALARSKLAVGSVGQAQTHLDAATLIAAEDQDAEMLSACGELRRALQDDAHSGADEPCRDTSSKGMSGS